MKKILSLLFALFACVSTVWAIDNGTYYLYNVATGQWLNFGGSDGYHATFFVHGAPIKVKATGSRYSLQGPFYDSPYMTAALGKSSTADLFTITEVEGGYTLTTTAGNKIGWDGTELTGVYSSRTVSTSPTDEGAIWQFYTKEDLEARLANASEENPVDATFYIDCPEIHRHNSGYVAKSTSAPYANQTWQGLSANYYGHAAKYNGNYVGFTFTNALDASQTLTGLPAGKYILSCQGFYRYGSNTTATAYTAETMPVEAKLYAGIDSAQLMPILAVQTTNSADIHTSSNWYRAYGDGYIPYPYTATGTTLPDSMNNAACAAIDHGFYADNRVQTTVGSDGTLKIGVCAPQRTDAWTVFDNFQLTYLGMDLAALKTTALQQIAAYEPLNTTGDAEFAKAIADAKTAVENASTLAEIEACVESVKTAYEYYLTHKEADEEAARQAAAEEAQKNMQPTDKAVDYTQFLVNADLTDGVNGWTTATGLTSTNTATSWSGVTAWKNHAPCVAEAYAGWDAWNMGAFSMTQQVYLTPGTYRLQAYGFYRWGSSPTSDISNTDSRKRSLAYLKAGNDSIVVWRLADISELDISGYGSYSGSTGYVAGDFKKGNYLNTLLFTVDKTQAVTLGFTGAHDRKQSWFIAGPFTLEKVTDEILAAEKEQEWQDEKASFETLKQQYAAIYAQGEGQEDEIPEGVEDYNGDIADADVAAATTEAEVEAAKDKLTAELGRYMQQSTLTFDLTSLITNPSFETGDYSGWDVNYEPYNTSYTYDMGAKSTSSSTYACSGSEGNYLYNTWWQGDAKSVSQQVLQTLSRLPEGQYRLSAGVTSNQAQTKSLYAWHFDTDGTTIIKSQTDDTGSNNSMENPVEVYFSMPALGPLRIGVYSAYWFKADDFRLEVAGLAATRKACANQWTRMTKVMQQAIDHSKYDEALARATEKLKNITTAEEGNPLTDSLRLVFCEVLKTYATNTEKGMFDLTPLLGDTNFDSGISDWTLGGNSASITYDSSNKNCEKYGTTSDMRFTQILKHMPAGHYTLQVQSFYRTRSTSVDADNYEKGIYDGKAQLRLGGKLNPIRSINSDARYTPSYSSDQGVANNLSAPNSLSGFRVACEQGRYWNTLSYDFPSDKNLTLGIYLYAGALSTTSWTPFDNFRLYYGDTPQEVALNEAEPFSIDHPIPNANVTLTKSLKGGAWTPICLPFDLTDISQLGTVARVLSAKDGIVTVQPVSSIETGKPYMVRPASDLSSITAQDVTIWPAKPDKVPTPWYDAMIEGSLDGYTFTIDGKAVSGTVQEVDYQNVDFTYMVENDNARRFLREVTYDDSNDSQIANYNNVPVGRRDQPNVAYVPVVPSEEARTLTLTRGEEQFVIDVPAAVDHVELGALIPAQVYTYQTSDGTSAGTIHPIGTLRMVKATGVSNIRDMGGWVNAAGRMIRYGKIYRGGEFNGTNEHEATAASLNLLRQIGIKSELDLRSWSADNVDCHTKSALNIEGYEDMQYRASNQWLSGASALTTDTTMVKWAGDLQFIMDNVLAERPVYFHCVWGADRTGIMGMLVGGLLGLDEDKIYKDYELTSFSWAGSRVKSTMATILAVIKGQSGATLQQKFENYCTQKLGLSADEIAQFQAYMLTDPTSDDLNAIDQVQIAQDGALPIYNVAGQRLTRRPDCGVYIQGHKKFVAK